MKKKILFVGVGILAIVFLFYYLAWSLAPGSYARAEIYELNVSEQKLIEIIDKIKQENNELNLKYTGFENGKEKFWKTIYFGYEDKNQIIQTWTRPKNKEITSFAFVSYKSGNDLGNWINANEYFWWWKNSKAKKEFEERILKKIKEKIEQAS